VLGNTAYNLIKAQSPLIRFAVDLLCNKLYDKLYEKSQQIIVKP